MDERRGGSGRVHNNLQVLARHFGGFRPFFRLSSSAIFSNV